MFFRKARAQQEKMLAEALGAVVAHLEDAPWLVGTLGLAHPTNTRHASVD
jgi:hypothetical protein